MRDYVTLGPTPAAEECAATGSEGFNERSIRECRVYIRQLERQFPIPEGVEAYYASRRFDDHDFGSYREVVLYFETEDTAAVNFALNVESNGPLKWDEAACQELGLCEQPQVAQQTTGGKTG